MIQIKKRLIKCLIEADDFTSKQALRGGRFVSLSRLDYVLLYGELFGRFVGAAEDGGPHGLGGFAYYVRILLVFLDLLLACSALTTELIPYLREESSERSWLFSGGSLVCHYVLTD